MPIVRSRGSIPSPMRREVSPHRARTVPGPAATGFPGRRPNRRRILGSDM